MSSLPFDLQQVRVFLVLADELHFGRTAERTGLTTSRVSQTIRQLERGIGGPLFHRTSRRVAITPLGRQLQGDLSQGYEQLHRAYEAGREAVTGLAGTLRIGMYNPVNGGPHLQQAIRAFETAHPACNVQMVDTGLARDQRTWLRQGEVDLLVTRTPLSDPDLVRGPTLSRDERIVAVAHHHPLAGRDSISWEDVADYPVTDNHAIPREIIDSIAPPFTPSGRPLRRAVVDSFPEIMMRVANGEVVHPTVRALLDYYHHPGVTGVPIRDLPPSETALMWRAGSESAKVRAFVIGLSRTLVGGPRH